MAGCPVLSENFTQYKLSKKLKSVFNYVISKKKLARISVIVVQLVSICISKHICSVSDFVRHCWNTAFGLFRVRTVDAAICRTAM